MDYAALATVLVAMGGVLKLVLDALKKADERHEAAILALQQRNETFLGNHLSANTRALSSVESALAGVVKTVEQLHKDNLRAAEVLKHADQHSTRKVEEQNMSALSKRLSDLEAKQK